ncbi:MAG: two-component system response regulator, partial [Desulfobulbaceae bacterium]|nr:two-component system response regulator [Desulfobulbaceae bacterium]
GYPDGIKGDSIPLATGIVSIADVYDALTSDRPYRKGFTKEKGLEVILELKGSYFKPELADFFVKKASENELAP